MLSKRTNRGFSLIELLVTMVIGTILAGSAAIGIVPRLAQQRLQNTADAVQQALQKTQLQAIGGRRSWTFALQPTPGTLRYAFYVTPTGGGTPANANWLSLPQGIGMDTAGTNTFPLVGGNYTVTFNDQGFVGSTGVLQFAVVPADVRQPKASVSINQLIGVVEKQCVYTGTTRSESCI